MLAQVAELVYAHVRGACAARLAGSNPALGTKTNFFWSELWDFTVKTKADFALRSEPSAARTASGAINSEKVSCGAVIIHFARTFFGLD